MIVHSCGVELAGLVDDLLGDRDLADVVQERGELEVAPPLGARGRAARRRRGSSATTLRQCCAGVAVVGLDDVAEHQRGAAVGVAQLERALQAPAALVGEHGEEAEQRHHRERAEDHVVGGLGGEQPAPASARRPPRTPTSLAVARRSWLGRAIAKRTAAIAKSTTNWAANAAISRAGAGVAGRRPRAIANTAAGPTENQALRDLEQQPAGPAVPRMTPGSLREREGDRDRDRHDRRAAPRTGAGRTPAASGP